MAVAVGAAVVLAATSVIPWRLHALAVGSVTLVIVAGGLWVRRDHDRLRPRIAGSAIAGLVGFAAAFVVVAETTAATFVLGAAIVALGAAALERARLRGAPVPVQTETNRRVAFEGTAHAIGDPPHVPGTDRDVAMWVAEHERQRWTSTSRFEIRDDQRRVIVDPAPARVRATPWLMSGAIGDAAARTLGADASLPRRLRTPIRVWSFRDGDQVHVVGTVTLENDPLAPTLRDPARVSVFTANPVIGAGRLTEARRRASVRLWLSTAIAIGAGALMAATAGGLG